MQRMQPRKPNNLLGHRRRNRQHRIRFSENQFERVAQRPEFASLYKCEIHLQRIRQKEYSIDPRSESNIMMVYRRMLGVQKASKVTQHGFNLLRIGNTKRKIDIRPFVFKIN